MAECIHLDLLKVVVAAQRNAYLVEVEEIQRVGAVNSIYSLEFVDHLCDHSNDYYIDLLNDYEWVSHDFLL